MRKLLIILLLTTSLFCQENVATFLETLYNNYKDDYQSKNNTEFLQFCENNNIDRTKEINQKHYYFISFLHDLFTSSSASDFVAGGILDIPYLWHWEDPNPRHFITFLPNSVSLSKVSPPDEFSRYKTYADIDRTPVLYLNDLFSDKPKYYHEEFGEFYTFGWCSEREMAFNSLLSLYAFGYDCKIKQEGIHVWSEIWIEFINNDGTYSDIIVRVDNTFDTISWENPPNIRSNNIKKRNHLIDLLIDIKSPRHFSKLDNIDFDHWQEPAHKIFNKRDWVIALYDDVHGSDPNLFYNVTIVKDSKGKYYENNYHYCGGGASEALDVFINGPDSHGKGWAIGAWDIWMGDSLLWTKMVRGKYERSLFFPEININENPLPFVDWVQDYGSGAQINWYNDQVKYKIKSVEKIIVSEKASNRIHKLVAKQLKRQ